MRQLKITKSITNRESASLDKYLQEIGREDLITVEEEVELAQRIRKGDRVALEKLTRANLRFVVSVAKQYQNQGLSLPDLINEGNLGLIKAAEKFDETRGFKFISYAVWWIRQSILQALAEQSRIVRLHERLSGMHSGGSEQIAQHQFEDDFGLIAKFVYVKRALETMVHGIGNKSKIAQQEALLSDLSHVALQCFAWLRLFVKGDELIVRVGLTPNPITFKF